MGRRGLNVHQKFAPTVLLRAMFSMLNKDFLKIPGKLLAARASRRLLAPCCGTFSNESNQSKTPCIFPVHSILVISYFLHYLNN